MNSPADSNTPALEPRYEEQFTAFVDFLGFSEASTDIDVETRLKVLALLQSLTTGTSYAITPAISTFSDHIVVSYPLQPIAAKETQETIQVILTLGQFQNLLAMVAAAALEIGFLIRGGATVGRLYHANGVVFGEALVEASSLEARTAIYPRVVLSNRITEKFSAEYRDRVGISTKSIAWLAGRS
jgi:hypothetical protein